MIWLVVKSQIDLYKVPRESNNTYRKAQINQNVYCKKKEQIDYPNLGQKSWVKINDDVRGMCNINSENKFETIMLKSSSCNYSDLSILVKGTKADIGQGADTTEIVANKNNKQLIIKNCNPFTDCIRGVKNTQGNNVKFSNVILPIYSSIEQGNIYWKMSGIF